ncbi:hypothetical protein ACHAXS_000574 [Conticribra weissflogii]
MFLYSIAFIPLVKILREDCPNVMQPWYADNLTLLVRHTLNGRCLKILTRIGPFFSYYPNSSKSWHISDEDKDIA